MFHQQIFVMLKTFYTSNCGSQTMKLGELPRSKSEFKTCLNPQNLVFWLARIALFPPCPGPACSGTYSFMADPHFCHPWGSHKAQGHVILDCMICTALCIIPYFKLYRSNFFSPYMCMSSKHLEFLFMQMKYSQHLNPRQWCICTPKTPTHSPRFM